MNKTRKYKEPVTVLLFNDQNPSTLTPSHGIPYFLASVLKNEFPGFGTLSFQGKLFGVNSQLVISVGDDAPSMETEHETEDVARSFADVVRFELKCTIWFFKSFNDRIPRLKLTFDRHVIKVVDEFETSFLREGFSYKNQINGVKIGVGIDMKEHILFKSSDGCAYNLCCYLNDLLGFSKLSFVGKFHRRPLMLTVSKTPRDPKKEYDPQKIMNSLISLLKNESDFQVRFFINASDTRPHLCFRGTKNAIEDITFHDDESDDDGDN